MCDACYREHFLRVRLTMFGWLCEIAVYVPGGQRSYARLVERATTNLM
jgi:hypothetical protein